MGLVITMLHNARTFSLLPKSVWATVGVELLKPRTLQGKKQGLLHIYRTVLVACVYRVYGQNG